MCTMPARVPAEEEERVVQVRVVDLNGDVVHPGSDAVGEPF